MCLYDWKALTSDKEKFALRKQNLVGLIKLLKFVLQSPRSMAPKNSSVPTQLYFLQAWLLHVPSTKKNITYYLD